MAEKMVDKKVWMTDAMRVDDSVAGWVCW